MFLMKNKNTTIIIARHDEVKIETSAILWCVSCSLTTPHPDNKSSFPLVVGAEYSIIFQNNVSCAFCWMI